MKKVTQPEYLDFIKSKTLSIMGTFTDIDGTMEFGYGEPAMDTTYGIDDTELCKIEHRHDENGKWKATYYIKR